MEETRRTAPALMRRYFLGELSEEEGSAIEESYLADEQAFAEAVAAEEELIEDYLEGRLSERERQAFRAHLLRSPHQRLGVQLVEELLRSGSPPAAVPTPARRRRWMALAAAAFIAAVAGALVWRGPRPSATPPPPPERAPAAATGDASRPAAPESAVPRPPERPPAASATLSFRLSPGRARGSGKAEEITVPRGTERVRLELDLAGVEGGSFAPVLRSAEGATVWRGEVLAASGAAEHGRAAVLVPAAALRPGDYVLVLRPHPASPPAPDAAEYFFRVLETKSPQI